jgi:hypothetical protein
MKAFPIVAGVLICFSLIMSGCQDQDAFAPLDNSVKTAAVPRAMAGKVTGVASAVWTLPEGTVVCNDSAAEYQMTVAKDNTLPSGSALTSKPPDTMQYFRLDIVAVMRILDKGKCLERDPSDDRVQLSVEGYYDGATHKFTALTCSKTSGVQKTSIESTSDDVVIGQVDCYYSEQMKYIFYFSDLKLK